MSIQVAIITTLTGDVTAVSQDGSVRSLRLGDSIYAGEELRLASNASVVIDYGNNDLVNLSGPQVIPFSDETITASAPTPLDNQVIDASTEAILALLEGDGDLLEELEAPAAGTEGAPEGGGSDFVRLIRVSESIDPLDFAFQQSSFQTTETLDFPNPVTTPDEPAIEASVEAPLIPDTIPPSADPVLSTANAGTPDFLPNDTVFYKRITVGGGVDADERGNAIPSVFEKVATMGGDDNQTSESNLTFQLTKLPEFGTLFIGDGLGNYVAITELPTESFNTESELYWVATKAQVDAANFVQPIIIDERLNQEFDGNPFPFPFDSPNIPIFIAPVNQVKTVGGGSASLSDWEVNGVTVHAYDYFGEKGEFLTFRPRGMGVDSSDSFNGNHPDKANAPDQLGHRQGKTETLVIDFDKPVLEATITLGGLFPNEGGTGETGRVTAFLSGETVGSWTFSGGNGSGIDLVVTGGPNGSFSLSDVVFDQLRFTATEYPDKTSATRGQDSSEYFIKQIDFVSVDLPAVEFEYNVVDESSNISDIAQVAIGFEGTHVPDFIGVGNNETYIGSDANDLFVGGPGDDSLTGNAGADTFLWQAGDEGTETAPASDLVTDFTLGSYTDTGVADRLNLADLLQGEHNDNLLDYMAAEQQGADTVLSVSTQGTLDTGSDQLITLENVSMDGLNSEQFIQSLIDNGNLQVDL